MRRLLLKAFLGVFGVGVGLAQAQVPVAGLKDAVKDFPRSQLQPQTTQPISIALNQSVRTCYETLGSIAGLNVLFNPDFRNTTISFNLERVDILEALDLLSAQTGSFIEVLDRRTIIVAPDTQANRRRLQTYAVETVLLTNATAPAEVTDIITALRKQLNISFIGQSTAPKAILIRDTPDKVASARRMIADLDKPKSGDTIQRPAPVSTVAFDAVGNIFIPDGGAVRKLRPARSQLRPKSTGLLSFNTNDNPRTTYETLGRTSGLNILFDSTFQNNGPLPFRIAEVDVIDALDYLSLQTGNFWEVLSSNTILVAPDNLSSRRQHENLTLKTIYLPASTTTLRATETVVALRTLLNMSFVATNTKAKAILLRDTQTRVALAEGIVRDMNIPGGQPPLQASAVSTGAINNSLGGGPHVRAWIPAPGQLELKVAGPVSINIDQGVRTSYATLAAMAGLTVTFDSTLTDSGPKPFRLDNVGVLDALDFLAFQTGTLWEAVDRNTIVVGPDNQTTLQKIVPKIEKTIALANAGGPAEVVEILTALRTLLNLTQIEARGNEIVIRDTPARIAVAQKVIADLDKP